MVCLPSNDRKEQNQGSQSSVPSTLATHGKARGRIADQSSREEAWASEAVRGTPEAALCLFGSESSFWEPNVISIQTLAIC